MAVDHEDHNLASITSVLDRISDYVDGDLDEPIWVSNHMIRQVLAKVGVLNGFKNWFVFKVFLAKEEALVDSLLVDPSSHLIAVAKLRMEDKADLFLLRLVDHDALNPLNSFSEVKPHISFPE